MKKIYSFIALFLIIPLFVSAQSEVGFSLGASNFWGDLGGANRKGRALFWDTEISATRPVLGLFYLGVKISANQFYTHK